MPTVLNEEDQGSRARTSIPHAEPKNTRLHQGVGGSNPLSSTILSISYRPPAPLNLLNIVELAGIRSCRIVNSVTYSADLIAPTH